MQRSPRLTRALAIATPLVLLACGAETQRVAAPPRRVPSELPGRYLIELGAIADRDAPASRWLYLELADAGGATSTTAVSAQAWRPDGQTVGVSAVQYHRGELTLGIDRAYDVYATEPHTHDREVIERWRIKARLRLPTKGGAGEPWLRGQAKVQIESAGLQDEDPLESTHTYRFVADRADDVDADELQGAFDDRIIVTDLRPAKGSVAPAVRVDPAQTYMPDAQAPKPKAKAPALKTVKRSKRPRARTKRRRPTSKAPRARKSNP